MTTVQNQASYPVPAMDVYAVRCLDCKAPERVACTAIFDGAPVNRPHARRYALAAEEARNGT